VFLQQTVKSQMDGFSEKSSTVSQLDALRKRARSSWYSMILHKSNIDPALRDELKNYASDHLSRLYHDQDLGFIRLRNFIVSPKEVNDEIERRLWLDSLRFRVTLVLLSIAAVASVVAAYEGWRTR
jgi:hypothetical protein